MPRPRAEGQQGQGKGGASGREVADGAASSARRRARLRDALRRRGVAPELMKELGLKNPIRFRKLEKIIVNMGLGEAVANPKILDTAVDELRAHHRPEAGRDPGQEVDRELQAARGPGDRRDGHAAPRRM